MSLILLHIAGAAALLIWAVRLVRTGVERAFSVPLRRFLRRSGENRLVAVTTGAGTALALQSATAVAILATGFVAAGTLAPATGLVILLGADLGSAVITQVLTIQPGWVTPLLLLVGVGLFLRGGRRGLRQTGRILIGLGLIFASLAMIRSATAPIRESEVMLEAMHALSADPVSVFALAAVFAWLVHSSVAAVLLIATLVAQGVVGLDGAPAMILGANLGGAFIAWPLTADAPPAARRIVLGNLMLRGGGAMLAMVLVPWVMPWLGDTPARQVLNLHLAFNAALAVLALPLAGWVLRLGEGILRDTPAAAGGLERSSALDPTAQHDPERALACATREILRMGEEVEAMLRSVIRLYSGWDDGTSEAIRAKGKQVAHMHMATKLYLAPLQDSDADEEVARKAMNLTSLSTNLDAAATTIASNLMPLAQRLRDKGLAFSGAGMAELQDFHDRVLANARTALNILLTDDPGAARALVEEKARVRQHEESLQRSHIERLRQGTSESIDTSNIHQETLRELKNVNSAFAAVAYPILAGSGDLLESRLKAPHEL